MGRSQAGACSPAPRFLRRPAVARFRPSVLEVCPRVRLFPFPKRRARPQPRAAEVGGIRKSLTAETRPAEPLIFWLAGRKPLEPETNGRDTGGDGAPAPSRFSGEQPRSDRSFQRGSHCGSPKIPIEDPSLDQREYVYWSMVPKSRAVIALIVVITGLFLCLLWFGTVSMLWDGAPGSDDPFVNATQRPTPTAASVEAADPRHARATGEVIPPGPVDRRPTQKPRPLPTLGLALWARSA